MEKLTVDVFLPVTASRLFAAWLDEDEHAAFTGSAAEIEPEVGGRFSAWDGYIEGTTLAIEPEVRLEQSWRTADFPDEAPDSHIEVQFEPEGEGTRLRIVHSAIPEGQAARYELGWSEYYFEPMQDYFSMFGKG